jgi:hypothetical protein
MPTTLLIVENGFVNISKQEIRGVLPDTLGHDIDPRLVEKGFGDCISVMCCRGLK